VGEGEVGVGEVQGGKRNHRGGGTGEGRTEAVLKAVIIVTVRVVIVIGKKFFTGQDSNGPKENHMARGPSVHQPLIRIGHRYRRHFPYQRNYCYRIIHPLQNVFFTPLNLRMASSYWYPSNLLEE
jgi:hypothetical protein